MPGFRPGNADCVRTKICPDLAQEQVLRRQLKKLLLFQLVSFDSSHVLPNSTLKRPFLAELRSPGITFQRLLLRK